MTGERSGPKGKAVTFGDGQLSESRLDYWDQFYASHPSRLSEEPSPFAHWFLGLAHAAAVLDLGCGNGRDSVFFASQGRKVIAVDGSDAAIRGVEDRSIVNGLADSLTAIKADVSALGVSPKLASAMGDLRAEGTTVAVYARFFLHAVPATTQDEFLAWCVENLRSGELIGLEFRTESLPSGAYFFGEHYRRPVHVAELLLAARSSGLEVVSSETSDDFAPFEDERPMVARVVLRCP